MVKFSLLTGIKGGQESTKSELENVIESAKTLIDYIDDGVITLVNNYGSPVHNVAVESYGIIQSALKKTPGYLESILDFINGEEVVFEDVVGGSVSRTMVERINPNIYSALQKSTSINQKSTREPKYTILFKTKHDLLEKISYALLCFQYEILVAKTYIEKIQPETAKGKIQKWLDLADNDIQRLITTILSNKTSKEIIPRDIITKSLASNPGDLYEHIPEYRRKSTLPLQPNKQYEDRIAKYRKLGAKGGRKKRTRTRKQGKRKSHKSRRRAQNT